MFFTSPIANITPALVSVAMSRSDSRDSTCSTSSTRTFSSAPMDVSYSTSPFYSYNNSFSRASFSSSSTRSSTISSSRRESSSQWIPSPYRSCMLHNSTDYAQEPSSYLSDDDLLYINCSGTSHALPIESIPNPEPLKRKEMSTEEHIAMLREQQERDQSTEGRRSSQQQKQVRFATEQRNTRRPSLQRRTTQVRHGLRQLNGPM